MKTAAAVLVAAALSLPPLAAAAQERSVPPIPFTEEFLTDSENIAAGGTIWAEQCTHCHGANAYPGKAPKLRPARYEPDFVYRRTSDGFRAMPAWKDIYTEEERMQITAYILSPRFAP